MKYSYLSKNWLILKAWDTLVARAASRYARGRLLDIGCGEKPFQELFAGRVSEYLGLEHPDTIHDKSVVDLWGTAENIPLPDESFDTILCTQVLEHVEQPKRALQEMYRVLREGGHCIITVPFLWHIHEAPRDFYRYTEYGIRYLLETSGFHVVEFTSVLGFFGVFGQELVYYLWRFRRGPILSLIITLLGCAIQALSSLLDRVQLLRDRSFVGGYMVIARKQNTGWGGECCLVHGGENGPSSNSG